jgi:kynurenine formamidase
VQKHDVLLVRTGFGAFWHDEAHYLEAAGVTKSGTLWAAEQPQKGIYILENLNLEELAHQRCYVFAFIGVPLKFQGATGSPLRPLALV